MDHEKINFIDKVKLLLLLDARRQDVYYKNTKIVMRSLALNLDTSVL